MDLEDINMVQSLSYYAKVRCKIKEEAEDVMQDVFLRLLLNPKFETLEKDEKKNYTIQIIKNRIIDLRRSEQRRKNNGWRMEVFEYVEPEIKAGVISKLALKEVMEEGKKHECFGTLKMNMEGYTCHEIADILGVSFNTVLGHFRYARKFIKRRFNYVEKNKKKKEITDSDN